MQMECLQTYSSVLRYYNTGACIGHNVDMYECNPQEIIKQGNTTILLWIAVPTSSFIFAPMIPRGT